MAHQLLIRIYGFLLHLYPRAFRADFGEEMKTVFTEAISAEAGAKQNGFLYLLMIPAMIGVYSLAEQVDFRQLTNQRAERVSQSIEKYSARVGRYPQNLQELRPLTYSRSQSQSSSTEKIGATTLVTTTTVSVTLPACIIVILAGLVKFIIAKEISPYSMVCARLKLQQFRIVTRITLTNIGKTGKKETINQNVMD